MPHVDEGTLHALLDGALRAESPGRAAEVEAHLAACADCRARLEAAEELRGEATAVLDAAGAEDVAAIPDFSDVVRRAESRPASDDPGTSRPANRRRRFRRQARWTRGVAWAASLVLALGTGYLIRDLAGPTAEGRARPERSEALDTPPVPAPSPALSPDMDDAAAQGDAAAVDRAAPVEEGNAVEEGRPAGAPAERAETRGGEAETATPEREAEARVAPPTASAEDARAGEEAGAPADARADDVPSEGARAEAVEAERPEELRAAGAVRSAFQPAPVRWSSVTVEEARAALDGPLYVLPRAELVEVYVLADDPRTRVLTLQRLQTGVPVQVVQWRGGAEESSAEDASEPSMGRDRSMVPTQAALPDAALPDVNVARVVRDDFVLELTGSLPAALLSVLGETADPAR